jgi:flagellar biosynthesis protein FlhF
MIIKKYVADTMNEALSLIKLEMGNDAIIVSKRMVKQKGLLGFFSPKKIEVTAAIDDKKENPKIERTAEPKKEDEKSEIGQELTEVKEMLQKLVVTNKEKKEKRLGIKKLLIERDVSENVVNNIIRETKDKEEYKNIVRLPDSAIIDEIGKLINIDEEKEARIHAFIGPTGVGKTTSIAKLAAIKSLNTGKKVGLITIDTYRIGAVEQLKIYADILGLSLEVINSTNDIEKSLDNLKDCDYIFVDTTGRSIKNIMQLSELKLYLDRIKPDKTYLVISMTTKYHDLLQILNGFGSFNYNSIILTKFDETTTYGSLINVAFFSKAPISYISVGQNVPDDIEDASREKLLDLVIGEGSI